MTERITELELANFKKEEAISGLIIENYKINKLI